MDLLDRARSGGGRRNHSLPVVDRDKRGVGILSLAGVASHEKDGRRGGNALREIAQPGGGHNQGDEERGRGM